MRASVLMVIVSTSVLACGKGDKGNASGAASGAAAGNPDEWKEYKIAKLPLKAMAPGDAAEAPMGNGLTALRDQCDVTILESTATSESFENTLHNIEVGNMGGPLKEAKRKVKTDDQNWLIEWTTDSKFGYQSRRTIAGKSYFCGATSRTDAAHQCAVKVCESLAPA
jgi:hypothetical protein